jgi:hypothetical protein|tara:strand:- start:1161 stop:2015 length:855 start_codon:yes stop_codon:yes gene_type:complete
VVSVTLKNKKKETKKLKGKSVNYTMFVGSEETSLVLQNYSITGITDISFNTTVEEDAVLLLAERGISRKVNKGHVVNCKISKPYLGKEIFQEFTGITNLSGRFIYGANAVEFTDGVISSYSISVDTQSSPKVSVDMKIFGDFKPTANITSGTVDYSFEELGPESVSIDVEGRNSTLTNFSYSVDFDVKPTYEINSIKSSSAKILSPIKYKSSAKMLMDEQEFEDVTGLIESETFNRNITFNIQDTGSNILNTYNIPNASLSSQEVKVAAGDLVEMSIEYAGFSI